MGKITIDPSQVKITERDIEEWLYQNPVEVGVDYWMERQWRVHSGIIDLLGIRVDSKAWPEIVVVEVKRGAIDGLALSQVCRYAQDIRYTLRLARKAEVLPPGFVSVDCVVVGESIDTHPFEEAEALGVQIFTFTMQLDVRVSGVSWKEEFVKQRDAEHQKQVDSDWLAFVVEQIGEDTQEQANTREQVIEND